MKAIIDFSNCKPAIKELFLMNKLELPVEINMETNTATIIESECSPQLINHCRFHYNRKLRKAEVKAYKSFTRFIGDKKLTREIKTNGIKADDLIKTMRFDLENIPSGAALYLVG